MTQLHHILIQAVLVLCQYLVPSFIRMTPTQATDVKECVAALQGVFGVLAYKNGKTAGESNGKTAGIAK